jgi:RNA-binding protein with serine-rich domain 1
MSYSHSPRANGTRGRSYSRDGSDYDRPRRSRDDRSRSPDRRDYGRSPTRSLSREPDLRSNRVRNVPHIVRQPLLSDPSEPEDASGVAQPGTPVLLLQSPILPNTSIRSLLPIQQEEMSLEEELLALAGSDSVIQSPTSQGSAPGMGLNDETLALAGGDDMDTELDVEGPYLLANKVIIENLTKNVTEAHLRNIFGTYGTISDVVMPMDTRHGFNKGAAWIEYEGNDASTEAWIRMADGWIDGVQVDVRKTTEGPDFYFGGWGSRSRSRSPIGNRYSDRDRYDDRNDRYVSPPSGAYRRNRSRSRSRSRSPPHRRNDRYRSPSPPSRRYRSRSPIGRRSRSPPRYSNRGGRGGDTYYGRGRATRSRSRSPYDSRSPSPRGYRGGGGGRRYSRDSRDRSRERR